MAYGPFSGVTGEDLIMDDLESKNERLRKRVGKSASIKELDFTDMVVVRRCTALGYGDTHDSEVKVMREPIRVMVLWSSPSSALLEIEFESFKPRQYEYWSGDRTEVVVSGHKNREIFFVKVDSRKRKGLYSWSKFHVS